MKNMKNRKRWFWLGTLLFCSLPGFGMKDFVWQTGKSMVIACDASEEPVVQVALDLFRRDCRSVLSQEPVVGNDTGGIYVGTIGKSRLIEELIGQHELDTTGLGAHKEAFLLTVLNDGRLVVAGSDKRGTAYGILQVSRMLGVSPWEWWADAVPQKRDSFCVKAGYRLLDYPDVPYRGIFINDEDWGINPWSWKQYEPTDVKGQMGPRTHERIFELLLRLRANTFWPAMHECSVPFFFTEGNKEVADRYGIYLGTSHCEPMMRNTNGEWKVAGKGEYDYLNNRRHVLDFWEERVRQQRRSDNIYTLGMRGVHDGKMQGAKTVEEQKDALTRIIADQRKMLSDHVNRDVTQVPQVLIPYKEVLDVYRAGLAEWEMSDNAFERIVAMTEVYNQGKWEGFMDYKPRNLAVYLPVPHVQATDSLVEDRSCLHKWNGLEAAEGNPVICEGLGYEGKAAGIGKGKSVAFCFSGNPSDSVEIELCLLPNHPIDNRELRIQVMLDGKATEPISYRTFGRSEEWKLNVLTNRARRIVRLPLASGEEHRLEIKALDEGVILDQVYVYPVGE